MTTHSDKAGAVERVEVIPSVREWAADWYINGEGLIEAYRAKILAGEWDGDQFVQFLAKFRLAHQQTVPEADLRAMFIEGVTWAMAGKQGRFEDAVKAAIENQAINLLSAHQQTATEAVRDEVERLREAISQVEHSIKQARVPGNDWKRELALIENTVNAALRNPQPLSSDEGEGI